MKFFYLLISTLLFLVSCRKEINNTSALIPADTVTLKRITVIEENSSTPGIDTVLTSHISYDNLSRITVWKDYMYNAMDTQIYRRYYAGEERLPYKITRTSSWLPANFEEYYFYNAAGKIIKDSVIKSNSIVIEWDVPITGGLKHISKHIAVPGGNTYYDTTTILQTIVQGNGIHEKHINAYNPTADFDIEYDDKPNVFNKLFPDHEHHFLFGNLAFGKNNPVRVSNSSIGNPDNISNYKYFYDPNNRVKIFENYSFTELAFTYYFYY